ncbi:MAG: YitT family protein [Treponema sp.]|nr:YitT family protein [Treponema sp.]
MKNSFDIKAESKRLLLILLGAVLMAMNIDSFVHSAKLLPGGFAGVTLLLQNIFVKFFNVKLPYSVVVYIFNIFPILIGIRYIGKKFTVYSIVMILVSGLFTDLFDGAKFLVLTEDSLLCAIFGGIVNAFSVSLCLFAGSSSGGTDFIAIYVAEKTGKSAWNYIFAFNCCVLAVAGILFGWDIALYSIIFQFTSTQTVNFLYKRYEKTTLLIVTDKPDEVYHVIKNLTHHAATVFEGRGEYSGKNHKLVYSVVSSDESGKLEGEIRKVDPDAFINVICSKEIVGKFFKRTND